MNVEVFHWIVEPHARHDAEVIGRSAQLMLGVNGVAETLLKDHKDWAAKGLKLIKVAEVTTDSAEKAFMLTNHIDRKWTENDCVFPEPGREFRSTSVGDLMKVGGVFHVVSNIGLRTIEVPGDLFDDMSSQPGKLRP